MFKTVLADPPWPYNSDKAIVGNAGRGTNKLANGGIATQVAALEHYNLMSIEDIKELHVKDVVDSNAHLYLWFTNAFAVEAHDVARAWGFQPKTIITWVKMKADGTPSMKTGYYYRGATEHILFCVRGSLRLQGPPAPTAILTPRIGNHSQKPEESYRMIEEQSVGPYLELFARRPRPGWSVWGNEVDSDSVFE